MGKRSFYRITLYLMQITPYHAKYFAFELTKRSSSDSLQKLASSLLDAQVDLNPHQVEVVYLPSILRFPGVQYWRMRLGWGKPSKRASLSHKNGLKENVKS